MRARLITILLIAPLFSFSQIVTEAGIQKGWSVTHGTIMGGYKYKRLESKAVFGAGINSKSYAGLETGVFFVDEVNFKLEMSIQAVYFDGSLGFTFPQLCPIYLLSKCNYLTFVLSPSHIGLRLRSSF